MAEDSSEHFRSFAGDLQRAIAQYGHADDASLYELQKAQVERLAALEEEFRVQLVRRRNCRRVYEAFIAHVRDNNKDILTARPYFRERQIVFSPHISTALRDRSWRRLLKYHINYHFVRFALAAVNWHPGSPLRRLGREIEAARHELVVMNLPLVIARARIFWSRTPRSHMSFMDFISVGVEGLIAAIDKYAGEYSEVWRSVAIGRMVGNFIESYSDTTLHFYPSDHRKLYRANKYLSKHPHGAADLGEVAAAVNGGAGRGQKTSPDEIGALLAAASTVSSDSRPPGTEEDVPTNVLGYEAPDDTRPDVIVEREEALAAVRRIVARLPLIDQKLLRLKGLDISPRVG